MNDSIVVIGAGIIGLTTAIRAQGHPSARPVHIIAAHLPDDPLDAEYASSAAGAHHVSFAEDGPKGARQRDWDLKTLAVFQEEYDRVGSETGLMAITENFTGSEKHLDIMEAYPNFKLQIAPEGVKYAASYSTFTMTPAIYLQHLVKRFEAAGGKIHRAKVASVEDPQIEALVGPVACTILCAGLHAPTLCEDTEEVYPIRGQVVKIRAPWVKEGSTRQVGALGGSKAGLRTYLIPNLDGILVVGGTRGDRDWEKGSREETTTDILKRALATFPQLHPPYPIDCSHLNHLRSLIVAEVVGFRPSRDAGVRLEAEAVDKVVYNYGHGGAGWQSSWATATEAVELCYSMMS